MKWNKKIIFVTSNVKRISNFYSKKKILKKFKKLNIKFIHFNVTKIYNINIFQYIKINILIIYIEILIIYNFNNILNFQEFN